MEKVLTRKDTSRTLTSVILNGNVQDLEPARDNDGAVSYLPPRNFLTDDIFSARDIVMLYDRSAGIHFVDDASKRDFNRALSGYDSVFGTDYAQRVPRDHVRVFSVLESYFRLRLSERKRIAFVIEIGRASCRERE